MGDKHIQEGQKDRCENQMRSPTVSSVLMSRMFIKDQNTVAIQTYIGEDSGKKNSRLLYLPNNSNKVFCFLPVPLFIDNEAAF